MKIHHRTGNNCRWHLSPNLRDCNSPLPPRSSTIAPVVVADAAVLVVGIVGRRERGRGA